jgi:hypothetical protein
MSASPIFVTSINVALSEDTALIFLAAPGGPIVDGKIQAAEAARLAVTHRTLREMSAVLAAKVRDLDAMQQRRALAARPPAEPRTFVDDIDSQPQFLDRAKH